jgi:hypothetical protein
VLPANGRARQRHEVDQPIPAGGDRDLSGRCQAGTAPDNGQRLIIDIGTRSANSFRISTPWMNDLEDIMGLIE